MSNFPTPLIDTNRNLMQYKMKSLCKESNQKLRHTEFYRYIKETKENYLVIKMKEIYKNLSTSCDTSLVLMFVYNHGISSDY